MFHYSSGQVPDIGAAFMNFLSPERAQQQQQQQQEYAKPPPAGYHAYHNLPKVTITADDLLEASNKECLICLEEQKMGTVAVKLGCGHIYHEECLKLWLKKSCTCPVCRYELETDDAQYEMSRRARMKKRRLRYRKDELDHMPISKLRDLLKQMNIGFAGCVDKRELVEKLVQSGLIDITEGLPVINFSESEFELKSVSELKKLLTSFGLSAEGMVEKKELRESLLNSGRIEVISSSASSSSVGMSNNYNIYHSDDGFNIMSAQDAAEDSPTVDETIDESVVPNYVSSAEIRDAETTATCSSSPTNQHDDHTFVSSNDLIVDSSTSYSWTPSSPTHAQGRSDSIPTSPVTATSPSSHSKTTASRCSSDHYFNSTTGKLEIPYADVCAMSIKMIKNIASAYGISTSTCVYKEDLIALLEECPSITVTRASTS